MRLIKLHTETLTDRHHHLGEQRTSIRIEPPVQGAPDPVVAQVLHLFGTHAEHPAGKAVHRLVLAIDRFSLDDYGAQQHPECSGV